MMRLGTRAERALAALNRGPKSPEMLSELLGFTRNDAAGVLRRLARAGWARVTYRDHRTITYEAIRKSAAPQSIERLEADYMGLRDRGFDQWSVRETLALTDASGERLERHYRLQTTRTAANSRDDTCPRFAHHDRHLAALAVVGSFPVMPSREARHVR